MLDDRMSYNRMHQYKCLCEKTANALLEDADNRSLNELFEGCPECREINLWTYWHGRKSLDEQNNAIHPKILLVGQDWGCCRANDNISIKEKLALVENHPEKYNETFCKPNNGTMTDSYLKCLFCAIDYNLDKEQPDLFFTNLIPYYRKKGIKISGFRRSWLTPAVKNCFRELVEILEPQVILCLGKNTYRGVLDSFGLGTEELMKDSYNSFLDSCNNFQRYKINEHSKCAVVALAHCGGLGIRNRSFEKQLGDWQQIKNLF